MRNKIKITVQVLFFLLGFALSGICQSVSKAYPTGIYIFCGNEIPKKFSYLIERKTKNDWKPVADLKAPQSEDECLASLMQLPPSIAAITPISKATIAFIWKRIKKSEIIDSLFAYSSDPRYQYVARIGWFDEDIREPGNYSYRIKKIDKNGAETSIIEVTVTYPSIPIISIITPVRFKLNEKSISISYSITDYSTIAGIKLYRSPYLKNSYNEVSAQLMFSRQKGEQVGVLTDEDVSKGLTYSYLAQPYDALGNKGKLTDTLNIFFMAKPSDIGLVTKLQAIPNPEKGGNLLKWDIDYSMNVNTIDIYRSSVYEGPYTLIAALNPTTKEYFDSREISPSITYYYYISINTGIGQSLPSVRVPAILEGKKVNNIPPQNLVATRKDDIVILKFNKLGNDIKGYYVYRGDGYIAPLVQLPKMLFSTDSILTYTDTLPQTINSMVYSYAVASINSSYNISPQSNRASISYGGGRLPVPEKVNAIMNGDDVLVTWSDAASIHGGVSSYKVFRKTIYKDKVEKPEELIATTSLSNNYFTDRLLIPGRYYSYYIQCIGYDTLDVGSISQPAGIFYKVDALLQPGNISAFPADNKIILKWTLPVDENLKSTLIYRSTENKQPDLLKELNTNTDTFEDYSAEKNVRYFYFIVLKYKEDRTSVPTDAVSAKWQ